MTQKTTCLNCSEWRDVCLNNVVRLHQILTGLSKPAIEDLEAITLHLDNLESRLEAWARAPLPGAEVEHVAAGSKNTWVEHVAAVSENAWRAAYQGQPPKTEEPAPTNGATEHEPVKRRGRPPGTKNRPKNVAVAQ